MDIKATGFASPALGYEEQTIDLNRLLVLNPPATYFVRLKTSDMADLGLPYGSLLVVDRSKDPIHNQYVLIRHDGQFYCRLMVESNSKTVFTDGTTEITPIPDETEIIGTVTASIKIYDNVN
jgi:DNA polymerase V